MRAITITFALVIAGVCAVSVPNVPQVQDEPVNVERNARFVGDLVSSALEDLSQQIREAGLDPWIYDGVGIEYELPVPVLFNINAIVENVVFSGLSNIVINHINFSLFSQRLTIDVSIPELSLYVGHGALDAVVLGTDINVHVNGRLSVIEPRISGEVVVRVLGVIGGSLIRSMNLEFDLGGIEYHGRVNVLGTDLTEQVHALTSKHIPNAISEHRLEINELVEIIAWELIEQMLS